MRLRISNLAWDNAPEFYRLVKMLGVPCVELAPTKIWPKLESVTDGDCQHFLKSQDLQGLQPVAFQSLLFGCPGLQLFQAPDDCLARLETVMRIAEWLGVRVLVFGSPKNRLTTPETVDSVLPILARAGALAERYHCALCIEPNPAIYGGNWALGLKETQTVIRELNHPGIRLHADTGAMLANGESVAQLEETFDILVSAHVSLPGLKPLSQGTETDLDLMRATVRALRAAPHLDSVGLEMAKVDSFAALEQNARIFTALAK